MEWFFQMEIAEHVILLIKIVLLAIDFAVIASIPFLPKVIKTIINRWVAKHSHVPSVQYLPESAKPEEKLTSDVVPGKQAEPESTTIEEDLQKARDEKKRLYTTYSIDKLRLIARDFGKTTGFKINKYYKLDKPSLIEALIQAEEMVSIEKAAEEASEPLDLPDDVDTV